MAFSFLVLAPFALRTPLDVHARFLRKQWRGVAFIGAFLAVNIGLNNISLLGITLSLNQVIRSAIPVVTCALAVLVEGVQPSREEAGALVVLSAGVMIAMWQGAVGGSPGSILCCVAGTISNGAMMTFSSKLLSEKLDVVRLTFYTAPVSLACLLPLCLWREARPFAAYWAAHAGGAGRVMALSSLMAVSYNLTHATMIKRLSAVTTTVVGEVKIVGLLLLSALLLGEARAFTPKMFLGCALAIIGFAMYGHAKLRGGGAGGGGGGAPWSAAKESLPLIRADKEATSPMPPQRDGSSGGLME
jgi:drug/metabolite transporter (DMT)-like permease